jgi:hypothetical protein
VLATLVPWVAALAARACGASWTASASAAIALVLAPEISVGLFGLTPDLLLALLWYGAVALSAWGLASEPGSFRALALALASGFVAGLATDAKVSGLLLVLGLAFGWSSPAAARHRKTIAPWSGLAVALVVLSPIVADEISRGFPMLRHRLVDTQKEVGLSARNLLALVGGQLVYVTPPLVWAALKLGRDLYRRRADDAISSMLWGLVLAASPLVVLSSLSKVAEPHWIAPLFLPLPLHLARAMERLTGENSRRDLRSASGDSSRRDLRSASVVISPALRRAAVGVGLFSVALAHARQRSLRVASGHPTRETRLRPVARSRKSGADRGGPALDDLCTDSRAAAGLDPGRMRGGRPRRFFEVATSGRLGARPGHSLRE